ncbi:MAG: polysaccharide deacetylase family protein [Bacillota bacterium]
MGKALIPRAAVILAVFLFILFPADMSLAVDRAGAAAGKIPVLVYHDVASQVSASDAANSSVISLADFEKQMAYLAQNGYYTASLQELERYVRGAGNLPEKTVVITFDDGYQSNYINCYPVLRKYGFRGAVFMIGYVPSGSRPHLTAAQAKNMVDSGVFEIGCHTFGMHKKTDGKAALKNFPAPVIKRDFDKFNYLCDMICIPKPFAIAYPFGEAGADAIGVASSAGYRMGFTMEKGYVRPGDPLMALNRIAIYPGIDIDKFADIVSGRLTS